MITQQRLREVLHYDPSTGKLTWLNPPSFRVKKGDVAGYKHKTLDGKSYIQTSIDNVKYYAHRLVWFYVTGQFPQGQIDHINGNGTDNRWCNLRVVSHLDNSKNQKLRSNNSSGVTGVYWSKERKKWCASITVRGKTIPLGRYDKIIDAIDSRKKAECKYKFHENHGQVRPL